MKQLQPIADGIWIAEGSEVDFHGFPYPTRMVIVQLASGALWVWSPIELCSDLLAEVSYIGTVSHLVSPNKLHHLFLSQWRERFPDAQLWGPAPTLARRPDLPFEPALTDEPPQAWAKEINQAWFRGSLFLDEVVFFHEASSTAIFADLVQAFGEEYLRAKWRPWQRSVARVLGITLAAGAHAPLDLRLSFLNRSPAREARAKVLDWRPKRVVVAHGEWQRTNGWAFIERSLSWLG